MSRGNKREGSNLFLCEHKLGVVGIHAARIAGIRLKDFLANPFVVA